MGAGPNVGDDPSPGVTRITWRDVPPGGRRPSSLGPFKAVLVAALLLGSTVLVLSFVDPTVLGIGGAPALSAPAVQTLSTTGESWSISDQAPKVVDFTRGDAGSLWMNLSVAGGWVWIAVCPANVVIQPFGFPTSGCYDSGGVQNRSGEFSAWGPGGGVAPAEIAFINEGPSSQSDSTVVLNWTTPLTVLSGGCGATCPSAPPMG